MLKELGESTEPPVIFGNIQPFIVGDTKDVKRKKHFELRYLICREAVGNKEGTVKYCTTQGMAACNLIKPAGLQKFIQVEKLLLINMLSLRIEMNQ